MAKSKSKSKRNDDYMERDFTCGAIRIYEGKAVDYGTISLDCGFAIRIVIREGKKGTHFICYPSFKNKKDEFINQAFCFDTDVIEELQKIIDEMYEE